MSPSTSNPSKSHSSKTHAQPSHEMEYSFIPPILAPNTASAFAFPERPTLTHPMPPPLPPLLSPPLYPLGAPLPLALALLTVALPLANPTPRPLTPLVLNIGAFLSPSAPPSSSPSPPHSPQHVRHDEEAHVRPPDVHLVQVADAAVARRHRDVLQLHVHVVLGLEQLAAVHLARGDLERHDVALRCASAVSTSGAEMGRGAQGRGRRTCASFSSLMGIPMVLVMVGVVGGVSSGGEDV